MALTAVALIAIAPNIVSCQSSEQKIAEYFRAGQEALRQGEFTRAAEDFKRVLALDPSLFQAEINLGLAYQGLSEYELALRHLTGGLRQKPELIAVNVIVGLDYLKLGSSEKGVPFLERALRLDPANQEARRALASSYLGQANFRSAAEQFRQIAFRNPDKAEAWFRLGHDYLELAARLAYRGAHLYRESAWGHRFLGDLLFQRSRWDEAVERYRNALRLDPREKGLHTALGEAYLHNGDLARAELEFRLELELDPKYELAYLGLTETALSRREVTAALEQVTRVWQISPEFLEMDREFPTIELPQTTLANLEELLKTVPEAPAKHFLERSLTVAFGEDHGSGSANAFHSDFLAWQKAVGTAVVQKQQACAAHRYSACADWLEGRKQWTNSERLLLGRTLLVLRRYQPASQALEQVSGVSSENAEASYWLARAYQALGAESYARLEEQFPDSWRNHQLRAEGYVLRQHPDEAVKEFQVALELRPDNPELHEALGELYLSNHSDEQGVKELETALKLDSARAHTLCLLGRVYVHNGESEKAVPYLQQALRAQPGSTEASSLLGTVYVHLGQFSNAIPQLKKAAAADYYGNVHYQLYQAYRKLGQEELARKALARSQDLRRSSLEHDQALIMGGSHADEEPQ